MNGAAALYKTTHGVGTVVLGKNLFPKYDKLWSDANLWEHAEIVQCEVAVLSKDKLEKLVDTTN